MARCGAWPCDSDDIAVTKRTSEGAIGVCLIHLGVSKEELAESKARGRKIGMAKRARDRMAVTAYKEATGLQ